MMRQKTLALPRCMRTSLDLAEVIKPTSMQGPSTGQHCAPCVQPLRACAAGWPWHLSAVEHRLANYFHSLGKGLTFQPPATSPFLLQVGSRVPPQ